MKRNILLYGAGGSGKSTLAAQAAQFTWESAGKKTRVVNADGGGTESAFQALIDLGRAEVWNVDTWDGSSIFAVLDLASKGWWPSDTQSPNSPLLPPTKDWRPCPTCGKDSGASGLAMVTKCAACGVAYGSGTLLPVRRDPINGLEGTGLVVFEGLTAFGELLLRRLCSIDPTGGNAIPDIGGFKIASPGMQHYGAAQRYIGQYVANSRQIPGAMTLWTALELRADDDGKPLYGPALPGKKLTALCIPWFTDVLHLDAIAKRDARGGIEKREGQEILERKLYLAPHFPSDNPAYKFTAKTSAPAGGGMPTILDPDMSLFFRELEKAVTKVKEGLK